MSGGATKTGPGPGPGGGGGSSASISGAAPGVAFIELARTKPGISFHEAEHQILPQPVMSIKALAGMDWTTAAWELGD